ncbi:MAG: Flp family type IVb pilin [Actinomycetota bacterium]|nr:Flp family type IVb pilin [Actinomycetota bacterium]
MIRHIVIRFSRDESGATAVEYGLLVALVAAAIIASVIIMGGKVGGFFTDFNDAFQ